MASNQQATDGEFEFDEEEHEIITLDDALEILEQENGEDDPMDSDDGQGDFERPERTAVNDTSVAHFASHSNSNKGVCSVFCLASHPTEPSLAVSGGEDDHAYLFRADTGEQVAKLSGHTDSVICVGFSSDGELVASGGMDGRIRLWRRVSGKGQSTGGAWHFAHWEFLTNLEGPDEVTCMAWHPKGPVLAVGSNDGTIWLYSCKFPGMIKREAKVQVPSGKVMGIFSGHSAAITDIKWASPTEGKKLVSASADSYLFVWDPKDVSQPPIARFNPSDARFACPGGITNIAINNTGALALIGSAEGGALRLVNIASGQFVATLGDSKQGHTRSESSSIEAVCFADLGQLGLWLTAGGDGAICAWDVSNNALRWKVQHTLQQDGDPSQKMDQDREDVDEAKDKTSISTLVVHPTQNTGHHQTILISTATAEGQVQTWDARDGKLVKTHEGHANAVHAISVSADGKMIVSAGDDGLVRTHAL